jgi:hypothetical protein
MKITKEMLKELIKEELETLEEMGGGPMMPEDEEENEAHGGEDHDDDEDMTEEQIVMQMEDLLDKLRDKLNV